LPARAGRQAAENPKMAAFHHALVVPSLRLSPASVRRGGESRADGSRPRPLETSENRALRRFETQLLVEQECRNTGDGTDAVPASCAAGRCRNGLACVRRYFW
jgi:hypothetical protein